MPRKTPVLLRKGPFSGRIEAITNYRMVTREGGKSPIVCVVGDGKHDVSADFDALMLEELIPDHDDDIVGNLDGAARGKELNKKERQDIADFRNRLIGVIERHNARNPK